MSWWIEQRTRRDLIMGDIVEDAVVTDSMEWLRAAEIRPQPGNRKILVPYMGITWMASRDPVLGGWALAGTNKRRYEQDIDHWMPVPDAPKEEQPHDAFSRMPRSMWREVEA